MSIYTSQGTIRVYCSLSNCGSGMKFFFVPDNDYSIKHGNKTFAVFVPKSCNCTPQSCSCTPQSCNKAIIRIYDRDKGNGVEIRAAESGCPENTESGCPENTESGCLENTKSGCPENTKSGCPENTKSGCPENTKSGCPEIISDAAVHQKKVEVWVKEVNESSQYPDLKITGITVPVK